MKQRTGAKVHKPFAGWLLVMGFGNLGIPLEIILFFNIYIKIDSLFYFR
jgi:hypothetical protein